MFYPMKSKHLRFLNFFIIAILVWGCGTSVMFRSSSGVDKDLQATWEKLNTTGQKSNSGQQNYSEQWTFANKNITIIQKDSSGTKTDTVYTGGYAVHTTLDEANVIFTVTTTKDKGFASIIDSKWTIRDLDKDILVMTRMGGSGGGLVMYEFTKKK